MAEEAPKSDMPAEEKKWSKWSVVSMTDSSLRCKRVNLADDRDTEYHHVPSPTFSVDELTAFAEFCKSGLLESNEVARAIHSRRYQENAFRVCDALNAPVPSAGK